MKKIILMFVVIMMTTMSALAQFPNHVREVMKKCDAKMATYNDGTGVVLDGTLKMKVSVLSLKGTMKSYVKDSKYFNILSMNAMGKEMLKMEMGFDGEQQWVYTVSDGSKDSLEITKTKAAKNEYGMKSDYDKEYSKAKMKEVGRYYEISFSGPKKKDIPKKAKIKVNEEGSEAAAVTVATMPNCVMPVRTLTFYINRPFVYIIREKTSGTILFMGKVRKL